MKKNRIFDYVVVLQNRHTPTLQKTGWLLVLLSVLPYAVILYKGSNNLGLYVIVFLLLSLLSSIFIDLKKKKPVRFMLFLLVAGLGMIVFSNMYPVGILYVAAGVLENFLSKKTEIGFSKEDIVISGIVSKKMNWSVLNNVIIKDGMLTMDYKNNTLFQAYTDDEDNDEYEASDEEFNAFCRQNLK